MKKILSLLKVSFNHDMNIFRINTKKQNNITKVLVPVLLTLYIMFIAGIYSYRLMNLLKNIHLEFVVLTIFGIGISFITLIEGIYKSSSLLFNVRDDDLVLSLPIKRRTILFIRLLKFYVFELIYNSLFLLPVIVVYAIFTLPSLNYYLTSFIALLVLPIIPIIISTIIGFISTTISSKFKSKNIIQTIITTLFIFFIFYLSYNTESLTENIVNNANNINYIITRLYFPVGVYIKLINNFNLLTLFKYIIIHILLLLVVIYLLSKIYFNINSNFKRVLLIHNNKKYHIKSHNKILSFIKKELNKFISTPVFITNAGFGLVLFIVSCILIPIKFNSILDYYIKLYPNLDVNYINSLIPVLLFGLICFTSFMTSITSSMISLEGKKINLLKTFPIKYVDIVLYKVISALVIIIPFIVIGDFIFFIKFNFDIVSIIILILASMILPLVSELIGININLKFPKFDATNDTEVVKQSMSSFISVLIGLILIVITFLSLYKLITYNININLVMLIMLVIFSLIASMLIFILYKYTNNYFKNFNV